MGIRQTLNARPMLAGGITVVALALAVGLVLWQTMGGTIQRPQNLPGSKVYFSDDDGQSFFAADAQTLTPFKHNNREAVRALVYQCDGGKPFVGYLERMTAEGRSHPPDALADVGRRRPKVGVVALVEIKKPGAKNAWVPVQQRNVPEWQKVMKVDCPDGQAGAPTRVFPTE